MILGIEALIGQCLIMLPDLSPILTYGPIIVGALGGTIGIISGVAVFARRRLRVVITATQNNNAHESWYTISVANRSDLTLSYQDLALGWFIVTPLGRLYLNWAYCPEEETSVRTLQPHGTDTFRIDEEFWSLPMPNERRRNAYLRAYLHLPSRGRGVWLPVRMSTWREGTIRERVLRRLYVKRQRTHRDDLPSL